MTVGTLLASAEQAGIKLFLRDGRLWYRADPPIERTILAALRRHRAELTSALSGVPGADAPPASTEIMWRAKAMAAQVPPVGPLRLLVARQGHWPLEPGRCWSCGEFVEDGPSSVGAPGDLVRCPACCEAAWLAIRSRRTPR